MGIYHYRSNYFTREKRPSVGVHFSQRAQKWLVRVKKKGMIVTLKMFETEQEANDVYSKYNAEQTA